MYYFAIKNSNDPSSVAIAETYQKCLEFANLEECDRFELYCVKAISINDAKMKIFGISLYNKEDVKYIGTNTY